MRHIATILALVLLAACGRQESDVDWSRYALNDAADSVAYRILEYHGGPATWHSVPYLRFDFGFEGGGDSRTMARHLWDRRTGDYRVEWPAAEGGTYTALLNVNDPDEARVFLDDEPVEGEGVDELRARAYQRFINDTYWLLSATKLFDEGVSRYHEPDSSGVQYDVIRVEFDAVGLTPGDRYWYWADRETGEVARWAYVLQGNPEASPTIFEWRDYRTFSAPGGSVRLAARKSALGADRAIVFPSLDLPSEVNREILFDPSLRL
jgi:hypothetical protein